ncbi:hypothetical protein U91I_00451 [alpha proteobacterium U9-1i]|nr:hypothetical protein U91I_00451 [alpha proteobacterium U9-1i]
MVSIIAASDSLSLLLMVSVPLGKTNILSLAPAQKARAVPVDFFDSPFSDDLPDANARDLRGRFVL